MKRLTFLLFCLLIGIGLAHAQTTNITGTVISLEENEPVIGASIVVKGTTIGTVTDIDGTFSLDVPSSAKTLVISFVGMKTQEVAVKPNIKVFLESDNQMLDEVMVVAYGTAKRSAFTGSASVVKAEEIGKIQTSNAMSTLAGKAAGVQLLTTSGQPGVSDPQIRIRGISSINAKSTPLIILDGSPFDGDMNSINTQDIESMTVLKDAASNALYGARGANGVIMITTKKGSGGDARVTLDAKWGVNSRATKTYNTINDPALYYETYYSSLKNMFLANGNSEAQAHYLANQNLCSTGSYGLWYNVYNVPAGQAMIGTNGKLNPNATLGNLVSYNGQEYLLTPDNWLDEAYHNSLRQEYNLTVSSGSNKSSFYSSFGYLKNEGIVDNSDYTRFVGRLKADYQVKDWLKIGANAAFTHYDMNSFASVDDGSTDGDGSPTSSGNIFAAATQVAPIYPLYIRDASGKPMIDANGNTMYDYGDGGNAGLQRPAFGNSNALSDAILNTNGSEGNTINGTAFAEITFLNDFKFTSTNSVYVDETRMTSVTNPYYGSYASSNGIVGKEHARRYSVNYQQLLNYTKAFGLHSITAMVGHEYYRTRFYDVYASKSNMFDPANHELSGAVTDGSNSSYTTDYNTEGYFGRVQYNYEEKYYASASYRRDASSRFHPDNRWGNFWSAGVAWLISKEKFFENLDLDWVDMIKIKASYGSQGNDNIADAYETPRYMNTYNIVNSSGYPAAVPNTLGNKDISWETNGNFNAGFDFEFFKNRLSGTFEFFNRKTSDMLFSFTLPPSYGYSSYYANIGDMRNRGVELELRGTVMQTKDFYWDLNLNLTHYKNKISRLPDERKLTTSPEGVGGYASGNHFFGEGIPMYTFYMQKYAGVSEDGLAQYYMDVTGEDGTVTREVTTDYSKATRYLCGTALPDVYGGFGTSLGWKGIDFSIDFAYQIGGQVYDADYMRAMTNPTANSKGNVLHADILNAWTPTHHTDIPRFNFGDSYAASASDRFLTSASYLSLQNINAGYTLPTRICRMFGLEKLRIYISADNVALWTKRRGLDPRQSITGEGTASYYAPIRTVSGGLTLTF